MRSRPFSRVNVVCSSSNPPKTSSYFNSGRGDRTPVLSTADFSAYTSYANQNVNAAKPNQTAPQQQQQQQRPTSTSSTPTKYGSLGGNDHANFSPSHTIHHNHQQHTGPAPPLEKDPALHPIGSIPSLRQSPSDIDAAGQGVLPIALEPTDDGIAAVATVILELPRGDGGAHSESQTGADGDGRSRGQDVPPDRICLGSSLVMMRVLYPMLMSHAQGARSLLIHRRRPSHPAS